MYARKKVYILKLLKVSQRSVKSDLFIISCRGWHTLKGQTASTLDFTGHTVSVATTQLCRCNLYLTQITHKWMCLSINKYLRILKFEFHIISTPQNKLLFLYNHLKMWKTFLAQRSYKRGNGSNLAHRLFANSWSTEKQKPHQKYDKHMNMYAKICIQFLETESYIKLGILFSEVLFNSNTCSSFSNSFFFFFFFSNSF